MIDAGLTLLRQALLLVRSGVPAGDLLERVESHTAAVWPGCRLSVHDGEPPWLQIHGPEGTLVVRPGEDLPANGPFDGPQRATAGAFAEILAEADARAALFRQVLRSNAWLARLDDLSRTINRETEISAIVQAGATGLGDLFGVDAVALYLVDDTTPTLIAWQGGPDRFPEQVQLVGADGRGLLGADQAPSLRLGASLDAAGRHQRTVLLHGQGGMEGLLVVGRSEGDGRFQDEAIPLIHAVAGHLATAVRNAQLLAEMRRLAAYDDLTGLAGRKHFMTELEREFDRARREARPLSLLMVDADHFKAINDQHGHPGGDAVLLMLADEFRRNTRTLDVVGRLGGEEFGVLLPGADAQIAGLVGERLRSAIDRARVPHGDVEIRVTVSVGAATWDRVCTPAGLLEAADQALYRAKNGGRNRLVSSVSLGTVDALGVAADVDKTQT